MSIIRVDYAADMLAELAQRCADHLVLQSNKPSSLLIFLPTLAAVARLREYLSVAMAGKGYPAFVAPDIIPLGHIGMDLLARMALAHGDEDAVQKLVELPYAISQSKLEAALAAILWQEAHEDGGRDLFTIDQAMSVAVDIVQLFYLYERDGIALSQMESALACEVMTLERQANLKRALSWWHHQALHENDVSEERLRLLKALWLIEFWQKHPPQHPVMIAGSLGTHHSTRCLMQAVQTLPQGEVWLQMSATPREALSMQHPDYLPAQLVHPNQPVEACASIMNKQTARQAQLLQLWAGAPLLYPPQDDPIHRINASDEWQAVQYAEYWLREHLAAGYEKLAIICADNALKKRLQMLLSQQQATPITQQASGLIQLWLSWLCQPSDRLGFLALLKAMIAPEHPLQPQWWQLIQPFESQIRKDNEQTEMIAMRWQSFCQSAPVSPMLRVLVDDCCRWFRDSLHLLSAGYNSVEIDILVKQLLTLSGMEVADETLSLLDEFADLLQRFAVPDMPQVGKLFQWVIEHHQSTPTSKVLPCALLSPAEARLLHFDALLMLPMNETAWRKEIVNPMAISVDDRALLKADQQRSQAQMAHDFVSLCCAARHVSWIVCQTLAQQPAIACHWLTLLETLECPVYVMADHYHDWVAEDYPASITMATPPAIHLSQRAYPDKISVSGVELWMGDPFAFCAKYVLQLKPVKPLDASADALEKGQILHRMMEQWAEWVNTNPDRALTAEFIALAAQAFAGLPPAIRLPWQARITAFASQICAMDAQLRLSADKVEAEVTMQAFLPLGGAKMQLEGRADRLETIAFHQRVIDYKTSQAPSAAEVDSGFFPQLPLLGWLIRQTRGKSVSELCYWLLQTTDANAYRAQQVDDEWFARYIARLQQCLMLYQNPDMPFAAMPSALTANPSKDYAHLARRSAWDDAG